MEGQQSDKDIDIGGGNSQGTAVDRESGVRRRTARVKTKSSDSAGGEQLMGPILRRKKVSTL